MDIGISRVTKYYHARYKILKRAQLWPQKSLRARDREELLVSVGVALQRWDWYWQDVKFVSEVSGHNGFFKEDDSCQNDSDVIIEKNWQANNLLCIIDL